VFYVLLIFLNLDDTAASIPLSNCARAAWVVWLHSFDRSFA